MKKGGGMHTALDDAAWTCCCFYALGIVISVCFRKKLQITKQRSWCWWWWCGGKVVGEGGSQSKVMRAPASLGVCMICKEREEKNENTQSQSRLRQH